MARPKKQPAKAKRPVGRPRHVATEENRLKVTELLSAGMPLADVALALRIDEKTLTRAYAQEVRFGRVERRVEVISLLFKAARTGNVSAIKHLDGITAVAAAESKVTEPGIEAQPKPRRLGKKEQAVLEAEQAGAGTDWAGDLGPMPETAH